MSIGERGAPTDFGFDEFAEQPEYVDVNRRLVNRVLPLANHLTIIDLACGTGLLSRLAKERLSEREASIVGIDPDEKSLKKARNEQRLMFDYPPAVFHQDFAQNLLDYVEPETIDFVLIGNALQEIPSEDREGVIRAAFSALKPGGKFVINSAFTDAWHDVDKNHNELDTVRKWREWKNRALEKLKKDAEIDFGSLPVFQFEGIRVEGLTQTLEETGFEVEKVSNETVELRPDSLRAIAKHAPFPLGFLGKASSDYIVPDYTVLGKMRDALIEAMTEMQRERASKGLGLFLERNWVSFVAIKPAA